MCVVCEYVFVIDMYVVVDLLVEFVGWDCCDVVYD